MRESWSFTDSFFTINGLAALRVFAIKRIFQCAKRTLNAQLFAAVRKHENTFILAKVSLSSIA